MLVIPAIDLKKDQVVRLSRGRFEQLSVYDGTPEETAGTFIARGARRLHVIVLWGAKEGRIPPEEEQHIRQIVGVRDAAGKQTCSIQIGGGIRRFSQIEYFLSEGIDFLILGTALLIPVFLESGYSMGDLRLLYQKSGKTFNAAEEVPEFDLLDLLDRSIKERIIVAVDYRDEETAISGWEVSLPLLPEYMIEQFLKHGFTRFLITNVDRDGTLKGVESPALVRMMNKFASWKKQPEIIVSGGIHHEEDFAFLMKTACPPKGVVVGKALYQKRLDFRHLVETYQEQQSP